VTRPRPRVWANILLALGSVAITAVVLELVARRFVAPWTPAPRKVDARVGSILVPHGEVHWTNLLDYDVTERANSLGFLDREPPAHAKAPGTFRVLALGDSFVEAAQVPIAQKFHVVLERMLADRYPGRRFETMALGRSGVGTAAELAYYESFGRTFEPDLVVVLFVHNDFADNSAVLGAIRTGWHPHHPPWPVFDVDPSGGGIEPVAIDPNFPSHTLPVDPAPPLAFRLRDRLIRSTLVRWTIQLGDHYWQWSAQHQEQRELGRLSALRRDGRFAAELAGWRFPEDLDLDEMFFATEMPPVFEEAATITDHVLGLFAAEKQRRGFAVVVAAVPQCSTTPWHERERRELVDRGSFLRLAGSATRHGLPVLDLAAAFARRGEPRTASWKHDAHWNDVGHRWAAEAIADFVVANATGLLPARDPR
jgi:hypothetical protein